MSKADGKAFKRRIVDLHLSEMVQRIHHIVNALAGYALPLPD